ncbi:MULTISPECIES: LysR family transcriptional regulator [Cobetia]|uniref:LysR family transcriptional regulator n=1 Tax=Cobetia marina TaxID=28258 RepID=A0ABU9GK70_COBMA|nr:MULTISPECIES: LysR family transcriptional regulator [Cobetia]MDH2291414.1 LysR family transcriptional regulator [Cobetia sp. 10Alg 146]MDH2374615.1 LysR family transcriptional regulator [Cobetia sp. 3AK]MDI6002380.1 LysR family transcriptional regulator [Cobetia pacifica]
MNLEHLKLFVRLAAVNSISQAGEDLGLSPAVASSHLRKLEDSLGVRLLHRTTRHVALSEEGRAFLPHAEEVLASAEAARAAVGAGTTTPTGTLRITASASFGRMHLIPGLAGFLARYPDLELDLRLTDTIVDLVEGGFDIAIRNSALKDSSLIARRLAPDKRILCASPQYLQRHGTPTRPAELKHHECLTLIGMDQWSFQHENRVEVIRIKGRIRTDNGEAVRDACAAGLGITLSSTWSLYRHLARGELVEVLPETPLVNETGIWAIYSSSRQLAPKIRAFLDYFSEYFGSPPYWDLPQS